MKTTYNLDKDPRKEVEISMTPMIDVIFLLLVFFIATTSFQVIERLLPSGVSELTPAKGDAATPPPEVAQAMLEQIVVKLASTPTGVTATINGQALGDWSELQMRFQDIAQISPGSPVIVDPEPTVQAVHVVAAYDWARASGLTRVYLATRAVK